MGRHPHPEARVKPGMSLEDALRLKADVTPGGCWLFKGATSLAGYGQMGWRGRYYRAHRLSYETFVGPIPEGLGLDHLCRVRRCINPDHLEPVTQATNLRRGHEARRNGGLMHPMPARTVRSTTDGEPVNTDLTAAEVSLIFKCTKRKITDEAARLGIGYNLGGRAGYRFTAADVEAMRRALTPPPRVEGRRIA